MKSTGKKRLKSLIICPLERVDQIKEGLQFSERVDVFPWFKSLYGRRYSHIYLIYPSNMTSTFRHEEQQVKYFQYASVIRCRLMPKGKFVEMN